MGHLGGLVQNKTKQNAKTHGDFLSSLETKLKSLR